LVTGHTGFIGTWLTLCLAELGADVTGFSLRPPSSPHHYGFLDLDRRITDVRGDIRNKQRVFRLLKECNPDVVFHLAARPILLESYNDPIGTYLTNTMGTLNLLEAVRRHGKTKAFLNMTTDKVYENKGTGAAYNEDDKLGGYDPYSSSKACSELITSAYRNSFLSGMGVATVRAGNIIGGGDWGSQRLVPDIARSYASNSTMTIRHPNYIRPWTYVLDFINGYLRLGERLCDGRGRYSGAWNFSSSDKKTVIDIITEFSKYMPIKYRIREEKRKHEDSILLLDSRKSRESLGWKPLYSFSDTVRSTASWYRHFYDDHGRPFAYSQTQVSELMERCGRKRRR
jgi:CDP-glucose 4,6-dehydratase